jgi:cell wall-associated NlpC family hydrolase
LRGYSGTSFRCMIHKLSNQSFRFILLFLVIMGGLGAGECLNHAEAREAGVYKQVFPTDSIRADSSKAFIKEEMIDSLILFGKQYLGLAYRYGGTTPAGFDCSGYVSFLFGHFGYSLPTSSSAMATVGEEVDYADVRKGDILLFKGRSTSSPRVGHVAVVIAKDSLGVQMMHSCRRGVIIDRYPQMEYYRARFLGVRRVKL